MCLSVGLPVYSVNSILSTRNRGWGRYTLLSVGWAMTVPDNFQESTEAALPKSSCHMAVALKCCLETGYSMNSYVMSVSYIELLLKLLIKTSMRWVNIRRRTEQLRKTRVIILGFEDKVKSFHHSGCVWFPHSLHFNHFWALFSIIPLLYNSWDIIKYVSHTMDHSSKCKPFIGQCRIAYNKVIKTWRSGLWIRQYEGEKGIMVRVSYGPSRSSKSQWWISMHFKFFLLPFSSWHREGNALCFLKDVQFSSLHPFRILLPNPQAIKSRI